MVPRSPDAFALSVRLLRGEVLQLVDAGGGRWQATATVLAWIFAGEPVAVVEGCAADVAFAILGRRLRAPERDGDG